MRGTATAHGAITFVNALATGIGAAAGVDLPVRATVEVTPATSGTRSYSAGAATPLVERSIESALDRYAGRGSWSVRTTIESSLPPARGLKSSSAVSSAVLRAVASATGADPTPEEVARFSADVSQRIGLSATGAYDDALAGLVPGIHVTENGARRELVRFPSPGNSEVVLWVPRRVHPPSVGLLARFRARRPEGEAAVRAVREGRWEEAMSANSRLVESLMGYDYAPLRGALAAAGARAVGVSGMGPTVAAICDSPALGAVLSALPRGTGDVIVTRFTDSGRLGGERA